MWIRGPVWDGCFMLSALWLAPIFWLLGRGHERFEDSGAAALYLALTVVLWIGHRFSSSYLAYCTSSYRPLLTSQRARFVWVPLAIFAGVFALLLPGDDVLPGTRAQRVTALAIVDYALLTWHFASQHFGVLSLYRLRAGGGARTRRVDRWFALGVGGVLVVVAELVSGTVFFQDVWIDPLIGPWIVAHAHALRVAGTAVVVAATAAAILIGRAGSARALYITGVAAVVATAFWLDPLTFIALWTVQHWTAAVGLTTVFAQQDGSPSSSWLRFWHPVSKRPALLLFALALVSAVLFPILVVEADAEAVRAGTPVAWIVDAATRSGVLPLLLALGFATAFLHYQLDRAVFRFSHPDVRRAAGSALR